MRVERLVAPLAQAAGRAGAAATAQAAAQLAGADLATATVTESTALAGVMGRHFALAGGSPPEVAQAVFEAVLPRSAADELPQSPAGVLLAIADRWGLGFIHVGLWVYP